MLYSCTHMAAVGFKGLRLKSSVECLHGTRLVTRACNVYADLDAAPCNTYRLDQ